MNRLFKRITVYTALGGAGLLLLGLGCYAAGARINTTRSIPLGLYWTSSNPVEKGAYVLFCPPQVGVFDEARQRGYIGAGFCPGNYSYMMKRVLAAKNDAVSVADDGVRVNGNLLPFSKPFKADKGDRPMPRYQSNSYTLGDYEVLLMTDVSPISFDSRYFGPINRSQIKTVITPVITW
jgi:conjugative transfer signal peptidase TraF